MSSRRRDPSVGAGARLVALAAFVAAVVVAPSAWGQDPVRLRVVTWNVWGVPAITTRLDERMAALPAALAALEPDLIVLQELWTKPHADAVTKRLAERGFRHAHWFEAERGATGLFVASKLPLATPSFRGFSLGKIPHSFWHLDWLVEKGVATVVVQTPLGPLRLEATHLQAQYRTDEYAPERLAQAVELITFGQEHEREATIVAGDFNGRSDELPRRVIRDLGGFEDAFPSSGDDTVYVRGGGDLALSVAGSRPALDAPMALSGGEREVLSDHRAVVVELELSRCAPCPRERRVTSATRAAALSSLERAAGSTPFRVALSLFAALALFVLGFGWKRRVKRFTAGTRRTVALRLAVLAVLGAAFVWMTYLGTIYYPTRGAALRAVALALESAPGARAE